MEGSATQKRIDRFLKSSFIAVYGIVWAAGLGLMLKGAWLLALPTAAAYVAMHVVEWVKRGRCWTSADSTAVPVSLPFYAAAFLLLRHLGYPPLQTAGYMELAVSYGCVLFLGHLVAILYAGAAEGLLLRVFRNRIESEKAAESAP